MRTRIWEHFDEISENRAKCKHCEREYTFGAARQNRFENLRSHLKHGHSAVYEAYKLPYARNSGQLNADGGNDNQVEQPPRKERKPAALGKRRSSHVRVWNHFEKSSESSAKCKHCQQEYRLSEATSNKTRNLRGHLKFAHSELYDALNTEKDAAQGAPGPSKHTEDEETDDGSGAEGDEDQDTSPEEATTFIELEVLKLMSSADVDALSYDDVVRCLQSTELVPRAVGCGYCKKEKTLYKLGNAFYWRCDDRNKDCYYEKVRAQVRNEREDTQYVTNAQSSSWWRDVLKILAYYLSGRSMRDTAYWLSIEQRVVQGWYVWLDATPRFADVRSGVDGGGGLEEQRSEATTTSSSSESSKKGSDSSRHRAAATTRTGPGNHPTTPSIPKPPGLEEGLAPEKIVAMVKLHRRPGYLIKYKHVESLDIFTSEQAEEYCPLLTSRYLLEHVF